MTWAIRSMALAAGAAALLSTQAAYAAPLKSRLAIDPLVSLSVLGTAQSRAAVCAAGAAAAAAGAATAAAQGVVPAPGCVLPVTAPPPPPPVTTTVAPLPPPVPGPGFNPLLGLLGALLILGVAAAVLTGGGDGEGDLAPVSPV